MDIEIGAPNRVAYVNRRGMLITASKERLSSNPFHPRRGAISGWAPFAAVVMATNDDTDNKIRQLENPAHDEISLKRLSPDQIELRRRIEAAGDQVTEILRDHLRSQEAVTLSNLQELASFIADVDTREPGNRKLTMRTIQARDRVNPIRPASDLDPNESENSLVPDKENENNAPISGGEGKGQGNKGGKGKGSRQSPSAPQIIQDLVVMRTSRNQLRIALVLTDTPTRRCSSRCIQEAKSTDLRIAFRSIGSWMLTPLRLKHCWKPECSG